MRSGLDRIGRTVTLKAAKRSCLDKKRYESRNHARDAASKNKRRFGEGAAGYWYACTLCSGWHLTSKPPQPETVSKRKGTAS